MSTVKRLDAQAILDRLPSGRTLILAGAAVLGLIVLGLGAWLWVSVGQSRGLAAYAEALARAEAGLAQDAPEAARSQSIREIEAVLAEYPSSRAASEAAYQLGNLRYANRQYAAARGAYEIALAGGAAGPIRALAAAGIAYTWEAEHDFSRAAEAFKRAGDRLRPEDFLYSDIQFGLARNQELGGQKDASIATYARILEEFPKGRPAEQARARLAALGAPAAP
jgi:tetratricopeptide (TPR) repeat protein